MADRLIGPKTRRFPSIPPDLVLSTYSGRTIVQRTENGSHHESKAQRLMVRGNSPVFLGSTFLIVSTRASAEAFVHP